MEEMCDNNIQERVISVIINVVKATGSRLYCLNYLLILFKVNFVSIAKYLVLKYSIGKNK